LVLVAGTFVFHIPGAVELAPPVSPGSPAEFGWFEALGVSINQFVFIPMPWGSRWRVTELPMVWLMPFAAYATVHRLLGWVLIPLGLAILTGLIRRTPRTGR
jgi:hypothetical protein